MFQTHYMPNALLWRQGSPHYWLTASLTWRNG